MNATLETVLIVVALVVAIVIGSVVGWQTGAVDDDSPEAMAARLDPGEAAVELTMSASDPTIETLQPGDRVLVSGRADEGGSFRMSGIQVVSVGQVSRALVDVKVVLVVPEGRAEQVSSAARAGTLSLSPQ